MRSRVAAWVVTPLAFVSALAGYAYLDVLDVVPGWVTDEPPPPDPSPFPVAVLPAAVDAPAVTPLPVADAPMPSAAVIQAMAERLRKDSRTGSSTNVSVVDIATGQVLADVGASEAQVPASNAKFLTGAATMIALGPDYRLHTAVTWDGAASGTSAAITLVAGGDMLLAADAGHGDATVEANGFAGLGDLADLTAAALTEAGVTSVTLAFDDSAFVGPGINPAWPAYAEPQGYVATVTGMAVNVGKTRDADYPTRWDDPSDHAARTFATRLEERGLAVAYAGEGPARGVELARIESAPMHGVLQYMLEHSDNTLAEVLPMVVAIHAGRASSTANGTDEMLKVLSGAGIPVDGVQLYDGSGFADSDRIPPAVLTGATVVLASDPNLDEMLEYLPIAGWTGTLDDRFLGTTATGLVRAKTGSLTGVTALSGTVVTADGRWLAFSVLADGMPYGQTRPRSAVDEFVNALAACGCDG